MYRRLITSSLLAVLGLIISCGSSGETVTTPENARPVTQGTSEKEARSEDETEVMLMKLNDFIKYGEVIPPMALTQEQKDGIILVLREWKDVLDSGNQADEALFLGKIASLLTEGQNAYEPVPEENGPSGSPGQSGPPSGGSGGPGGGQGGPPSGGNSESGAPGGEKKEELSLSDKLDMMIRLLSGEEAGGPRDGGPPPPPSEG